VLQPSVCHSLLGWARTHSTRRVGHHGHASITRCRCLRRAGGLRCLVLKTCTPSLCLTRMTSGIERTGQGHTNHTTRTPQSSFQVLADARIHPPLSLRRCNVLTRAYCSWHTRAQLERADTYVHSQTNSQILNQTISSALGFTSIVMNERLTGVLNDAHPMVSPAPRRYRSTSAMQS
jgi:hypothetical protein